MTDPIIAAARLSVTEAFDTLRRVVGGMPADALNWRPAGDETNSIAVLVTHASHATRLLLHLAAGLELPPRDRPAEFRATVDGPAPLTELIDRMDAECGDLLEGIESIDWGAQRRRRRDDGSVLEMPAAYALFHAVDHLRGHADEASLTRHVWQARPASG